MQGQDQRRCWADRAGTRQVATLDGRAVQGREKASKSADRAGIGPTEMLGGRNREKQDRKPDRVNGKQESRRYRDMDRRARVRTVQGQDQTRCWADRARTRQGEQERGRYRNRTRRARAQTEHEQVQTRYWVDRAGTRQARSQTEHEQVQTRYRADGRDQTSSRTDGAGTGPDDMPGGPCSGNQANRARPRQRQT